MIISSTVIEEKNMTCITTQTFLDELTNSVFTPTKTKSDKK